MSDGREEKGRERSLAPLWKFRSVASLTTPDPLVLAPVCYAGAAFRRLCRAQTCPRGAALEASPTCSRPHEASFAVAERPATYQLMPGQGQGQVGATQQHMYAQQSGMPMAQMSRVSDRLSFCFVFSSREGSRKNIFEEHSLVPKSLKCRGSHCEKESIFGSLILDS